MFQAEAQSRTVASDPIRDDTVLQHSLMIDEFDVSSELNHRGLVVFLVAELSWYSRRVAQRGITSCNHGSDLRLGLKLSGR